MWHLTAVKFQLVNEMIFLSYFWINVANNIILMLPTLFQMYDENSFDFFIHFRNEGLSKILQAVRCHILW